MTHHEDQFHAGDFDAVLHAGEGFRADHVAGYSNAEHVAKSQIENQFGGHSRIDAAQYDGQRCLALCRRVDLPHEVSRKLVARAESAVAFAQDFENLVGGRLILQFARRVVSKLDVIIQAVLLAEASQADSDIALWRCLLFELANQTQHVWIDVVGVCRVDQQMRAGHSILEELVQRSSVEKADLIRQFDMRDFAADVGLDDSANRSSQVAVQDEKHADSQPDQNADEQVCQNDRHQRDHKRCELVAAFAPHLLEEFRAGQFETGDKQNRRQSCQRDHVQINRQKDDADQQQQSVEDRRDFRFAA